MRNGMIVLGVGAILAMAIYAAPLTTLAADISAKVPGSIEPPAHTKKSGASTAYRGKVSAVDASGMTLTVGKLVLEVSPDTRIIKNGHPATLDQGTVDEIVSGSYRKEADGKLHAVSIRFGGYGGKKHKEMHASSS